MQVRLVEPEDISDWLRMRCALWPRSDEEHATEIAAFFRAQSDGLPLAETVLVCTSADEGLTGFVEISVRSYAEGCTGPTPYIEGWYVDAGARRQGVGRALMTAAEEWARARGYAELASDAKLENLANQSAHRALGFQEVERAVQYRKTL